MSLTTIQYLQRIQSCNQYDLTQFLPFWVGHRRIGYIHEHHLALLKSFPGLDIRFDGIHFKTADTPEARTEVMASICQDLYQQGILASWVGEAYRVSEVFDGDELFTIERAAATFFGIQKYGVHLNAYCIINGQYHLWVARRAKDKPTWPDKLDHLVAGGHARGYAVRETLRKECEEEAGIPAEIASQAIPVGIVDYNLQCGQKLSRDILFTYDLHLDQDFEPRNTDGEVEQFYLWPIDKVLDIVANTDEYKLNCNLVIIDFAIRHGFIQPDDPFYIPITQNLRNNQLYAR